MKTLTVVTTLFGILFFAWIPNAYSAISNSDRQEIQPRQKLVNGNFQNGKAHWTATSGTLSIDSTNYIDGKASGLLTMSSQQGSLDQDATPGEQYAGVNLEASCYVKTSQTNIQVCSRAADATQSGNCVSIPSDNQWHQGIVNFSAGNGQDIGVHVGATASDTGTWNQGLCYVGPARNTLPGAQQITNWQSCDTLTIGAVTTAPTKGTPVIDQCRYRRVGDTIQFHYTYEQNTSGSAGTGQYLFPIPAGLTADTTQVTADSVNGTIVGGGQASNAVNFTGNDSVDFKCYVYDSSHVACRGIGSAADSFQLFGSAGNVTLAQTNAHFNFNVYVPVTQYKSYSVLTTTDQSDFGWTNVSIAPPSGAFGTVSGGSYQEKRIGDTLYVSGYFTSGTMAAGNMAVPIPGSLTLDTAKMTATANVKPFGDFWRISSGAAINGTSSAAFHGALFWDGSDTSNLYFGWQTASNAFAKEAGNTLANGDSFAFSYAVPISQWVNTNRAPNLIGSVTSSDPAKSYHDEDGQAGTTAAPCTVSPCSPMTQTGSWVQSSGVTRTSTGVYPVAFTASEFSASPFCSAQCVSNTGCQCQSQSATTSGMTVYCTNTTTAAAMDAAFTFHCKGTR